MKIIRRNGFKIYKFQTNIESNDFLQIINDIKNSLKNNEKNIVFDFYRINSISSYVIKSIIIAHKKIVKNKGKFYVLVNNRLKDVLLAIRLNQVVSIISKKEDLENLIN